MVKQYISDLKKEFSGYGKRTLMADLLAGVTVAAVALPLALAFGVSSGADASAGLITAIIAAFVIGSLSGASFQISGPTGAMAVILIQLATKQGLEVVFAAGMLAGAILIVAGIFKAGKVISFIPKAVITGFTSGIALVLALGQIENFLGVQSFGDQIYERIFNIFSDGLLPNLFAVGIGLFVIFLIFLWPKKWGSRMPATLVAVIIATAAQMIFNFNVDTVGEIPRTIIHDTRLTFDSFLGIPIETIIMPAISIAALCMIESLLCGTVGGKMKGEKPRNNRELVAQGVGNMVLPFFGGIPSTAVIARTSVGIKSGGATRLTGIFHGIILLLSMFLLGSLMSQIPMAALAGVLIAVAWRMNDWASIKYLFNKKFYGAIASFLITLACTIIFDLTIAIAIGVFLSFFVYVIRISNISVTISEFDPKRLDSELKTPKHVQIIYITGAVFFGSTERFTEKMKQTKGAVLILSMRGVPNVDISGVQEILEFCENKQKEGTKVLFCGIQPNVKKFFDQAGVTSEIGEQNFFWEAKDALKSLN